MTFLNNLSKLINFQKKVWIAIGNFETSKVKKNLNNINNPLFICGLARSGTTIMLEIIASHPDVVTHRYSDYPMLYTPYWWNNTLNFLDKFNSNKEPHERSHKDRIKVSSNSPEAMEEIIWMSFFDNLHNYEESNILNSGTKNEPFENFYKEHIQKLLFARNKKIYASKGNYNLSRIEYLLKIIPGSKFIIMVRDPLQHIYSSIKQDRLFCSEHKKNKATLEHMNLSGHFEFGQNKIPINFGNTETTCKIKEMFKYEKSYVEAWINYWNDAHKFIYERLNKKQNILIVRYEDLCTKSEETLRNVLNFCKLDNEVKIINEYKNRLSQPDYYKIDLAKNDIDKIKSLTKETAQLFGYP